MSVQAFPLSWPPGWPRHKGQRDSDSRFKGPTYRWDRVYRGLREELTRIGARHITVSTNQPLRQDGVPYAQERIIHDPGVAVYFTRNGKAMVMAQDRFQTVLGNMRSLTMAIEGLRQMERHGGAVMLERAFDGFAALPPPEDCWTILGIAPLKHDPHERDRGTPTPREKIMMAFRQRAREGHGTGADMDRLVRARDEALEKVCA